MANKLFIIVLVATITFYGVLEANKLYSAKLNDLVIGYNRPGNVQVFSQTFNVPGVNGTLISRSVHIDAIYRNLTLIRALDQNRNGTGGLASLSAGGIGRRNATLYLRSSAPGRGIHFVVDAFAL